MLHQKTKCLLLTLPLLPPPIGFPSLFTQHADTIKKIKVHKISKHKSTEEKFKNTSGSTCKVAYIIGSLQGTVDREGYLLIHIRSKKDSVYELHLAVKKSKSGSQGNN